MATAVAEAVSLAVTVTQTATARIQNESDAMRVGLVVLLTLAPAAAAVTSRYQRKAALGTPCDDLDGAACGPGAGAAAADGVEQVHTPFFLGSGFLRRTDLLCVCLWRMEART